MSHTHHHVSRGQCSKRAHAIRDFVYGIGWQLGPNLRKGWAAQYEKLQGIMWSYPREWDYVQHTRPSRNQQSCELRRIAAANRDLAPPGYVQDPNSEWFIEDDGDWPDYRKPHQDFW